MFLRKTLLKRHSHTIDYYGVPYRPCGDHWSGMGILLTTKGA